MSIKEIYLVLFYLKRIEIAILSSFGHQKPRKMIKNLLDAKSSQFLFYQENLKKVERCPFGEPKYQKGSRVFVKNGDGCARVQFQMDIYQKVVGFCLKSFSPKIYLYYKNHLFSWKTLCGWCFPLSKFYRKYLSGLHAVCCSSS